jgi:hypothetical protein
VAEHVDAVTLKNLVDTITTASSISDCQENITGAFDSEEQYALSLMLAADAALTLLKATLALQNRRGQKKGGNRCVWLQGTAYA